MSRPLLALRADGGPGIGAGHLARSVALGQEWARRGDVVLVSDSVPSPWRERAAAAGIAVVPRAESPTTADWWVADGYVLDPADRTGAGARVATVDDHDTAATGGAGADLVVDQNLGADASAYPSARGPVLAGIRYASLRRELLDAAGSTAPGDGASGDDRTVVVLIAGGAPSPAVRAAFEDLAAELRDWGHGEVHLLDGAADVVPVLQRATVAVAAAGSTCWELCRFGIPAVVVAVADNQRPLAVALDRAGAAIGLAALDVDAARSAVIELVEDPQRRSAMGAVGRALVDGWGARRVVSEMRSQLLHLRPAEPSDAADVHRWNDDPTVRAASFSPAPIPWADHERWFAARLADPTTPIFVATDPAGAPLGLVRFAVEGPAAEIGVALDPTRQGDGWGPALIAAGCSALGAHVAQQGQRAPATITARIKADNERSTRAFRAADFDPEVSREAGVLRYVRPMRAAR